MTKNIKEVDAQLRALREQKKEMLAEKHENADRRKILVHGRAKARANAIKSKKELRKLLTLIDAEMKNAEDPTNTAEFLDEIQDSADMLVENLGCFFQLKQELDAL